MSDAKVTIFQARGFKPALVDEKSPLIALSLHLAKNSGNF
jgi:hypothetical protein